MKSSFERFRLYHIDQSLRIRFQDLAGNDLGLRAGNYGSVKNVGVEDTPRISEPLSFFEKTLFSSAPTGVSHR